MHQPNVEFKKKKIHQNRERERGRERERVREREYSPFYVGKIWIEWKREKQIFIINEIGRRRVKTKGR